MQICIIPPRNRVKRKKQTNPAQQIEAKNKNKKQLKLTEVTLPRYQVADKEATEIQKRPEIELNTSTRKPRALLLFLQYFNIMFI